MAPNLDTCPFQARHALDLDLRAEAAPALALLPPLAELAKVYETAGPAWTVLSSGKAIACGGVVRFWPGVGECWCWTGREAQAQPVGFARLARRLLERLAQEHRFHRLQAHVRVSDVCANRFVEHLGFERECLCVGFGPDQATHHLYRRLFTWKE